MDFKITLPFVPPTTNKLYTKYGFIEKPTKESKELIKKISQICQYLREDILLFVDVPLKVTIELHSNWLTQKNTIKKSCIEKRATFIKNSVFNAIEIDDKMIVDYTLRKIQSEEEKTIITIEVEEGWMI